MAQQQAIGGPARAISCYMVFMCSMLRLKKWPIAVLTWGNLMILSLMASASVVMVTPATINTVLATARPGAVIRLAPGNYGTVSIRKRNWSKPITLEGGKARLTLNVTESSGLIVRGGTFVGNAAKTNSGGDYALILRSSKNVLLEGIRVSDSTLGIAIMTSNHIRITRAEIVGMLADGIDIASSQHVTINDSSCTNFRTQIGQALHPDCIQMWSSPKEGVTQDITIERNRAIGPMQGITGFNHVRNGTDDGGFDRIVIRDNYVANIYPHGVYINACRNCTITGNAVETLPGSRWRTWVRAPDCVNCRMEGNREGPKR